MEHSSSRIEKYLDSFILRQNFFHPFPKYNLKNESCSFLFQYDDASIRFIDMCKQPFSKEKQLSSKLLSKIYFRIRFRRPYCHLPKKKREIILVIFVIKQLYTKKSTIPLE